MQIESKLLKAVLLAAGKKDIRYCLNGICVNAKHIVATDGKRMHVAAHMQDDWEGAQIVIPRESVELALKMKTPSVTITQSAINGIPFTPLDGRYPDYTRVMPQLSQPVDIGALHTQVNPDFLSDAVAAVKLVTGHDHVSLTSIGGTMVWSNRQLQVVVMPLRDANSDKFPKMVSLVPLAN